MRKPEHQIQNEIRLALSANKCTVFRINVGSIRLPDGTFFQTGVPKGHPDLYFFRWSDGRIGYVEVKNEHGRLRKEQIQFHKMLMKRKIIHCCARSAEDAVMTAKKGLIGFGYPGWKGEHL